MRSSDILQIRKHSKFVTTIILSVIFCGVGTQVRAQFTTNGSSVYLTNINNRLGIGTTSVPERLTVYPAGAGGILIGHPTTTSGGKTSLRLGVSADAGGYSYITSTKSAGTNGGFLTLNPSAGAVGIGTGTLEYSDAEYRLFVLKGIRTEKVKVDLSAGWADFVLAPDYRLRPLAEVEAFIRQHRHLPDVPSEADLKREGLDLGAMHKLQIQKIEELTLYLIDLKKENEALRARIERLESSKK